MRKMRYNMKIVGSFEDIEKAAPLKIDNYRWTEKPGPRTEAKAVLVKNRGFLVEMRCYELNPLAVHDEPDGPVHLDSCLEFFVNFNPRKDKRYVNLEANALGNLHCKIGTGRNDRAALSQLNCQMPETGVRILDDSWILTLFIPIDTVKALYGRENFKAGDIIRANFYKCGDETESPHFGMWSDIDEPMPDFHLPKYFGELVLSD